MTAYDGGGDDNNGSYDDGDDNNGSGYDEHLPNPDHPKLHQTHEGEHHEDFGDGPVKITRSTYIYAFCAAVNSCNLGYDLGVSTEAGKLIQDDFDLTRIQREIFVGSINFWASKYLRRNILITCRCVLKALAQLFLTFTPPPRRWTLFFPHSVRCVCGPVFHRYLWPTKDLYCGGRWFYYRHCRYGVFEFLQPLDVRPYVCGPRCRRRTRSKFVPSFVDIATIPDIDVSGTW
jgi:hypothetical protein